ncbi:MAG: hypothetical protein ACJ8FY_22385 [Gemmataceae bacterium]
MRSRQILRTFGFILIMLGVACSGSKKPVKVEGIVKVGGIPTADVLVQFLSQEKDGHDANGTTDENGVFHLTTFNTNDGALPGSYKVIVAKSKAGSDTVTKANPNDTDAMRKAMMEGMVNGARNRKAAPKSELPEIYSKAATTTLKYQIPYDGKIEIEIPSK